MKNSINKIDTPHPHEHHAVYRWYKLSSYFIGSLIALCVLVNAYQYYELVTQGTCSKIVARTKQEIAALASQLQTLNATHTTLKEQTRLLSALPTHQPALYLKTIATVIPDDTCLVSADINKSTGMQLNGYTKSAESLKQFVKELSGSTFFKAINLTSLQPETTDSTVLRFSIQAQLQSAQD